MIAIAVAALAIFLVAPAILLLKILGIIHGPL